MGINKQNINPLNPFFDFGVDLTGTFDWSGPHSWGTSAGVAGFANFYADEAGKGLVWDGDATPGNACLKLTGKSNTDRHFHVDISLTSKPSGGGFFSPVYVAATASYTGGGLIMVAQQFDMTDSRTVNAAGQDFLRAFSMNNFRTSSYTSSVTSGAGIESIFTDTRDAGYYSNAAGAGWNTYNNRFDTALAPKVALTSAKTYTWRLIKASSTSLGLDAASTGYANFTYDAGLLDFGTATIVTATVFAFPATCNFTGIDFQWGFTYLPGGTQTVNFINYNPTFTAAGGTLSSHYFAKIMKGRTWIGADGADTTTTWDGQLCFGAGVDSAIYDTGTDLCIATDFQGAGSRNLNLVDQTYSAITTETLAGYVTIKIGGTARKIAVVA